MHTARVAFMGALLIATVGCSDIGDSSAVPCGNTISPATPDGSLNASPDAGGSDTSIQGQDGSDVTASSSDVYSEAIQGSDSNGNGSSSSAGGSNGSTDDDAGMVEPPPPSTTGTSVPDAETQDSASDDSSPNGGGSSDAGQADATVQDAATDAANEADATIADSGGGDAARDSGGADATGEDASDASREPDVGAADTGSGGGGLTPCTSAPCGSNTVQCDGNTNHNNVCTPTEAIIVARDIAKGNVSSGTLTMNSCYECMLGIGCLDDDSFMDTNHECADLSASGVALDNESYSQACLDTLSCILDQKCDTGNPPSDCFCGSATVTACFVTAGAANGPCLNQEVNGLPKVSGASCTMGSFASGGSSPSCTPGDLTATNNAYTDQAQPTGMANALVGCGYTNCKSECTP